jgi:hypothetical protein
MNQNSRMVKQVVGLAVLGGLLAVGAAPAAGAKAPLTFVKVVDLPDMGLRMKVMVDAQETPPPSPSVYTYTYRQGTNAWKEDQYEPAVLWRTRQLAGRWVGRHNNTLTLATIQKPLPVGFTREYVTRKTYDERLAATAVPAEWTDEALAAWVAAFAGVSNATAIPVARPPLRLKPLIEFVLGDQPTSQVAYVFQLNRVATGQQNAPTNWFCALFDLNPEVDMDQARRAIAADFFGTLAYAGAKGLTATGTGPAKPVTAKPGPAPVEHTPEFLASRQQVVDSIRNMKDWWHIETDNFLILSNMKRGANVLVDKLKVDLELLRGVFMQCVPPSKPLNSVSVIRVFGTGEEYLRYLGGKEADWTAGMWVPLKKELLIRPVDWGTKKNQRGEILETVYHESFHQYLFYVLDQVESSAWFNEGHADFFEAAKILNGKVEVGESDEAARAIDQLMARDEYDLRGLLHMPYHKFYSGTMEGIHQHYASAWLLVYYLRKGAPLDKPPRYAGILDKYVAALRETQDADKATDAAFEGVDLKEFRQELEKFWKSGNRRGMAKRNPAFGPAAAREPAGAASALSGPAGRPAGGGAP